jgi:uncharacterized membrane protein
MDRMLVVVFENESKTNEGVKVLEELDLHGSITVYSHAVVVKKPDGSITVGQCDDRGPSGLMLGIAVGGFLGALGGPVGLAIGGSLGFLVGAAADLNNARVGEDFIDDVSKSLSPNKAAVVAEIEEGSTDGVDTRMEAIGGTVFRRALSEVRHSIHDEHIAAIKADLAQMKAEHAQTQAVRKIKLEEEINQLESRLQAQLRKAKEKREVAERVAWAKAEILRAKAAAAKARAEELHVKL